MSKAIKLSLFILIFFLAVSLIFGFYSLVQKQKLEKEKGFLQDELSQSQAREKDSVIKMKKLEEEAKSAAEEKDQLSKQLEESKKQVENIFSQIDEVARERDQWKKEIDDVRKERDDLLVKIDELSKKESEEVSRKTKETSLASGMSSDSINPSTIPSITDEEYWASVLREKASLEVEIDKFKEELLRQTISSVELKESNAKFQMELDALGRAKEDMEREIENKEQVINNLSLELARAKNDRKFAADTIEKLNSESVGLRDELKNFISMKSSLEKSIILLMEDKNKLERKLAESEGLIQGKIDELWGMKSSLDQKIKISQPKPAADKKQPPKKSRELELPPIVVRSGGEDLSEVRDGQKENVGLNGQILSVNDENNFVIISLGENTGIREADTLNVYRGSQYIAQLEVIQVRKDISAADIKEQTTNLQVGDLVK